MRACRLIDEREHALSEMGIHVAGSAIAVDITKSYLVNINADPSMNEMLVCVFPPASSAAMRALSIRYCRAYSNVRKTHTDSMFCVDIT